GAVPGLDDEREVIPHGVAGVVGVEVQVELHRRRSIVDVGLFGQRRRVPVDVDLVGVDLDVVRELDGPGEDLLLDLGLVGPRDLNPRLLLVAHDDDVDRRARRVVVAVVAYANGQLVRLTYVSPEERRELRARGEVREKALPRNRRSERLRIRDFVGLDAVLAD